MPTTGYAHFVIAKLDFLHELHERFGFSFAVLHRRNMRKFDIAVMMITLF